MAEVETVSPALTAAFAAMDAAEVALTAKPFTLGVRPPGAAPMWQPGQSGNPNKTGYDKITSRNIRAAVCEALTRIGGVEYLTRCALRCPKAFLSLLSKVIPQRIEVEAGEISYATLVQELQQARDRAELPVIDSPALPAVEVADEPAR